MVFGGYRNGDKGALIGVVRGTEFDVGGRGICTDRESSAILDIDLQREQHQVRFPIG